MCGIAGTWDRHGPDRDRLDRSVDAMRHRGPDDAATWCSGAVGLGHARLAIIDRAHGAQPFVTDDGRYAVVFNGEIYDHHRLREELTARGYRFRTRCDTEVLPWLYDAEGPAMVDRLRGMFAFAIADLERDEIFLARDRFGKKPLYLASGLTGLSFASTLDALLPLLDERPDLDPSAIAEYLSFQYVPADRSPWVGVEKVPPGTWIRWRAGAEADRRRYWLPPAPASRAEATPDPRGELRARIREAVSIRLESEVPLGVFLSGGLDSSVVVAELRELGAVPRTFSVGFADAAFDERSYAALVAARFGSAHTTLVPDTDVPALFRRFTEAYDEPFADSSALATLAVAQAAAEHVTVVLTGDGGDELFAGYDRYRIHRLSELADRVPAVVRRTGGAMGARLARSLGSARIASAFAYASVDHWAAYRDHMFHFPPDRAISLLARDVRAAVERDAATVRLDAVRAEGSQGDRVWVPWVDALTYLPDDLLTKMDRATMAFGVEARSPFLDHELWSFVAALPRSSLLNVRRGKVILRDAYRGILPDPVLDRPKQGFGVPIAAWMRGPLGAEIRGLLLDPVEPVGGVLDAAAVRGSVGRFLAGDDREAARTWNLLALAGWHRKRAAAVVA